MNVTCHVTLCHATVTLCPSRVIVRVPVPCKEKEGGGLCVDPGRAPSRPAHTAHPPAATQATPNEDPE